MGLRHPHTGVSALSSGFPLGSYWDTGLCSLSFSTPVIQSLYKSCTIYLKPNHFSQVPFHSSQANAILALEACPGSLILSWLPLLPSACALHSSQRNYFKTSISSCPSCAQNSPVFLTQKVPTVTHKALHSPCPFSALSSLPRPRPSRTGPRAHM